MIEINRHVLQCNDQLLSEPLDVQGQVKHNGKVRVPEGPGLGVIPDSAFIAHYEIDI